jgi:hypothetical protein
MGNDGETTSNERSKVQGEGAPQKCTDHSIASRRQQAHGGGWGWWGRLRKFFAC